MKVGDMIRWKGQKKFVGIIISRYLDSIDVLSRSGEILCDLSPHAFEVVK